MTRTTARRYTRVITGWCSIVALARLGIAIAAELAR